MAILCDKNTKLLVQGMGKMGSFSRIKRFIKSSAKAGSLPALLGLGSEMIIRHFVQQGLFFRWCFRPARTGR